MENNAILADWTGPFQGVPAFDQVKLSELEPAFAHLLAEELAGVERIANDPAPPSFENTIIALEKNSLKLMDAGVYYRIWGANLSTPEFREIQARLSPVFSAHSSKIKQNQQLFERIKAVHSSEELKLRSPDERRLVQLIYDSFADHGATLGDEEKKRFAAINQELAKLHVQFSNNVLADEEKYLHLLEKSQMDGLPTSFVESAEKAASELGHPGKFAIANTRSAMEPFLTYAEDRETRKKVWEVYYSRGDNGDAHDNNQILTRILQLRHERVRLLGFENYGAWRLKNRMAVNPANAEQLMKKVWDAAIAQVHQEVEDMQAIADSEGDGISIEPWDYRYYAEKVRRKKYDFEASTIKEYLQLDNLREAMFYVAGRLFDLEFVTTQENSVPVYHPDVKVWEVRKKSTGDHIGLWYLDPYARKGKKSGAWATTYRIHTSFVVDQKF